MTSILFASGAKRLALSLALLAGLAALLISVAPSIMAQDNPRPPHWFWGVDLTSYVGDQVVAINQDGEQVGSSPVDSDGGWSVAVSPEDAQTITLQLITDSGTRATDSLDVMDGGFDGDGLSITDFKHRVVEEVEAVGETLPIQIIARLRDDRTPRTFEFSIRINGVDADPPPRLRHHTPGLDRNRWYQSSLIDAGDGFEVRVIACRQDDEDMLFGVRVEGHDDIIPRLHRIGASHSRNNWLQSNEIEVPEPGDNDNAIRLRIDDDCSRSALGQ